MPKRLQICRQVEIAFHARRLKFNFSGLWHSQQVHNALLPVALENLEMFERMGVSFPT
jgi:hypothetical protein